MEAGFSSELYAAISEYGVAADANILDVCCGDGAASEPFITGGARVTGVDASETLLDVAKERFPKAKWVKGTAEKLPAANGAFDAAISAQSFHDVDRKAALNEMIRVVKPGGTIAIWWKHLMNDDPAKLAREEVFAALGVPPPPNGLTGGFVEFYSAPLAEHALRVIPWRIGISLETFMAQERSAQGIASKLGPRAPDYYTMLEHNLQERVGDGSVSLGFLQFLYLGKTG